ncbi:MAG: DUF4199 domain-containing protein [Saprospiraceae bacterium]
MDTLDNPNRIIDPSGVSYQRLAFQHGAYAALIIIVIGLITNLTGINDPTNPQTAVTWTINLLTWGVMVAFIVMAVKKHREEDLGGYITFGRAFGVSFLVILALSVISAIWTYVYFAFIDPELIGKIMEGSLAKNGMDADQAEAMMENMKWMFSPGFFTGTVFLGSLFIGAIISLIVSLVMKKDAPGQI